MTVDSDGLGPDPTSQALIRLVPKLGPIVATWRQETHERKQKRAEQLGAAAAGEIGAEQLFRQIAADDRLTDMFNTAVEAAVATSSDAKIRLLGRALASGAIAKDQAHVDEAEQLLRVAVELDPVDLRALRALERWHSSDPEGSVAFALGVGPAVAGPIVARLQRLHLIKVERLASVSDKKDPDDDQVNIDEEWSITPTTEALMALLDQRADSIAADETRQAGALWAGFTSSQAIVLEKLAGRGQFDWLTKTPSRADRIGQLLDTLDALGVPYVRVREAMQSIGYGRRELEALDRWETLAT